jgi:hypothetical protein
LDTLPHHTLNSSRIGYTTTQHTQQLQDRIHYHTTHNSSRIGYTTTPHTQQLRKTTIPDLERFLIWNNFKIIDQTENGGDIFLRNVG